MERVHRRRSLASRVRSWFGRRTADREFNEEIEAHLRLLAERYTAQGMTETEAASAARRQFGNVGLLKEANREMRGIRFIETFVQDLRYGVRILRKNPGFTFVAVLTLALGIGANTAIFSVVNAVLLRSLPYRDPDRLVMLSYYRSRLGYDYTHSAEYLEWREWATVFERVAGYHFGTADLTGSGDPERVPAGFVSANLFSTLGVVPRVGRDFTPEEDMAGGPGAVILSDGYWRQRFHGDPQVIGRSFTIGKESRTVVGIMPSGFRFGEDADVWLPLEYDSPDHLARKKFDRLRVIARLKPGETTASARAALSVILDQQKKAFPDLYQRFWEVHPIVIGLDESLVGGVRLALLAIFGAVAFVLLIACTNLANLMLARSSARRREMAIRAAVGAGRARLARQLLTESLLLSAAGGGVGLIAATWCVKLLLRVSPPWIARIDESRVDGCVLLFTCGVAAVTGVLAGVIPALQASKADVNETLKKQSTGKNSIGLISVLMVVEVALALILLVGAGLMIKSFSRLLSVPKGYDPEGVITVPLTPNPTKYPSGSPLRAVFFQETLARVQSIPGLQYVSLASVTPYEGTRDRMPVQIVGRSPDDQEKGPDFDANFVSPDYFRAMGVRLLAGRVFTAQDGASASKVLIINETIAKRFFERENPIGRQVIMGDITGDALRTIVGVVNDVRYLSLDQTSQLEAYLPIGQHLNFGMNLAVRAASDQNTPAGLANLKNAIRNQLRAQEPYEPVNEILALEDRLSRSRAVTGRRFHTLLIGAFAGTALLIAAVGIYGVISYAVSGRTHEIGIRMALGAERRQVLRLILGQGMKLTLLGATLGLAGALALTRVIKTMLFNVSATDPATFAAVALLLIVVALVACYLPAKRATQVDPVVALRSE
jgi:predicted permease